MNFFSIILLAIGLSMDSLAISYTSGSILKQFNLKNALKIALFMGVVQGIMPGIGWILGVDFKDLICNYDHWIAFFILLIIGGKMILDAFSDKKAQHSFNPLQTTVLLGLAIATSIDAMAIGLSFAFLSLPILFPSVVIGTVTFSISFGGVYAGSRLSNRLPSQIDILGGIILIGIGTKILIEHLYFN